MGTGRERHNADEPITVRKRRKYDDDVDDDDDDDDNEEEENEEEKTMYWFIKSLNGVGKQLLIKP